MIRFLVTMCACHDNVCKSKDVLYSSLFSFLVLSDADSRAKERCFGSGFYGPGGPEVCGSGTIEAALGLIDAFVGSAGSRRVRRLWAAEPSDLWTEA